MVKGWKEDCYRTIAYRTVGAVREWSHGNNFSICERSIHIQYFVQKTQNGSFIIIKGFTEFGNMNFRQKKWPHTQKTIRIHCGQISPFMSYSTVPLDMNRISSTLNLCSQKSSAFKRPFHSSWCQKHSHIFQGETIYHLSNPPTCVCTLVSNKSDEFLYSFSFSYWPLLVWSLPSAAWDWRYRRYRR